MLIKLETLFTNPRFILQKLADEVNNRQLDPEGCMVSIELVPVTLLDTTKRLTFEEAKDEG